jgi:hypothetical protein
MDESGFTGEDLLQSEQPVFVHVSTSLTDEECAALIDEHFSRVQSKELKHKNLARRQSGQARILAFLNAIRGQDKFTTWLCHKEFTLLTYLVDLWVETSMHAHGIDLYKDGGNVALSNMTYYCLRAFQSDEFLRAHLERFQRMMRSRTPQNYQHFFEKLHKDYLMVDKRTRDILVFYIGAGMDVGFDRLRAMPRRAIDPAFTTAVSTCMHWHKRTAAPLRLIHDKSSSLAKDKWLWDAITSPEIENVILGISGRELVYPLNVVETRFEDSEAYLQLQFCDLVAGAYAEWARQFMDLPHDKSYGSGLEQAGLKDSDAFNLSVIWPSPEVDPDALGMTGWTGAGVEFLTRQLAELDKRRGGRG